MSTRLAAVVRSPYDFVVGDDPRLAAAVLAVIAVGGLLVRLSLLRGTLVAVAVAVGVMAVAAAAVLAEHRQEGTTGAPGDHDARLHG